jgi:methylated-DNA-protein-cysteine methyltransferase related protein
MSSHARIYDAVRRIPRGRVATYGGVASEAGLPGRARQVGYALAALGRTAGGDDVPWHRVINGRGQVSARAGGPAFEHLQRALLEAEGVAFDRRGRVDLDRYGWP